MTAESAAGAAQAWVEAIPQDVIDDYGLDEFRGYGGGDFLWEIDAVRRLMVGDEDQRVPSLAGSMTIARLADLEGAVDAFQIEAPMSIGGQVYYVGKFMEYRDMTLDREAQGFAAFAAIVGALYQAWVQVRDDIGGVS